jgi:hydrogenase-4 component E
MINLLTLIFTVTLIYLTTGSRLVGYIRLLALQGLILCGLAFYELHDFNYANLLFITLETLIFKAILVPYVLLILVKKNNFHNERDADNPNFFALFKVSLIIIVSFVLSYSLKDEHLKMVYFTGSISAILTGLLLIVRRKKIITQIVGYMVFENGIFLLSLSIGGEMPMIVNVGVLLDLITCLFLFGMFVSKIGEIYKTEDLNELSELKD